MGLNTEIRRIVVDVVEQEVSKTVDRVLEKKAGQQRDPGGPPRLYTVGEVAEAVRADVKTVRAWIAKGLLRARKKPGMKEYRISESDLLEFYSARGYEPQELDLDKEAARILASTSKGRR